LALGVLVLVVGCLLRGFALGLLGILLVALLDGLGHLLLEGIRLALLLVGHGWSHGRELGLVLGQGIGKRGGGKRRGERVEAQHGGQEVHRGFAHERSLIAEPPDAQVRDDEPVRQRNRLLLRHRGPRLEHPGASEGADVVSAVHEEVKEALLGAE
jgi:hypothetical protein